MSIRLRLTLLYSTILGLTLIAFSIGLYLVLANTTISVVKDTLADEAKRLLNERSVSYDRTRHSIVVSIPFGKFTTQNTFVQARHPNGEVRYRSPNLYDIVLPLEDAIRDKVYSEGYAYDYTKVQNERLLIYYKAVDIAPSTDGQHQWVGMIQVARSLQDQDRALDALRRNLILGSSIATIIAFGVGWALAGAALRPIDKLTQTAHAIGAERDFGRRVPHTGPQDEIGRLAATINTMLAALQGAYRQEAQALQAQRRFVADASHELRTPLTTIRGNLALLKREPPIDAEDRVAVLNDMVDESERMSRLVADLLALARVDAGRPLRREPLHLRPLIEDTCRKARALGRSQQIVCDSVADAEVLGDADALRQVLLILLDNALKFTPATGWIRLSSAVDDRRVAIRVQDTGVGIAPDVLPHIFERFYRGDTTRTGGGAGLGLAIAKALVQAQDGAIEVESKPGVGSIFTVRLPRAASRAALPAEHDLVANTK